ncbi:hypothetical protein HZ994_07260 [Akkermansiaceae bacterium]|nr:hypothetical protein HZ994_07260 [Akkermansiaceae bacterium]
MPPRPNSSCRLSWLSMQLMVVSSLACPGQTVYQTDFENFQAGPNRLVGTENWVGNSTTSGSHGIDQDAIPGSGLGKTAFIGFAPPAGAINPVLVSRSVNLNPATNSEPIIEFESLLGIKDSTNAFRDSFWISFFNISHGTRLAHIRFANEANSSWIYYGDGVGITNTQVNFIPGEIHLLLVRIDLVMNRWSAYLDGIPLFNGVPFTALTGTSAGRTLGSVGAEWRRSGLSWGDNWMLIADWQVRMMPLQLNSAARDGAGGFVIRWTGDPARSYQIQHSDELGEWKNTLPGSTFPTQTNHGILSFTDSGALPAQRFYRVLRTP